MPFFYRFISMLVITVSLSCNSIAHEVKAGPNGGPITDLGELHLELVMKSQKIELYVTDANGDPVDVADGGAKVIILAGTKKLTTTLEPVADSVLGTTFSVADSGPYTVVVVVALKDRKPVQGRFKLNELLSLRTLQIAKA